jgi:electron transfer flavoprotein alpha subunit
MTNEYRGVWTLGEVRGGTVHSVSYELLSWGRDLADALEVPLSAVLLGHNVADQASDLIAGGADQVYVVDAPELETFKPDSYTKTLASLVRRHKPEIFIASATSTGRTVMPLLYVDTETGLTADCTELTIEKTERLLLQTRPAIGGNVMADIRTPTGRPQMCTVRPRSKKPLPLDRSRTGKIFRETVDTPDLSSAMQLLEFLPEKNVGAPLQDAEVIVAGGKGMKNAKNFAMLQELARLLGGTVGASRTAVDLNWAPYSSQVGLSGKSVTPRLYIACGISGAVQHLAGMSASDTVIAINTDPEAPIFRVADLAIVGDVLEVVPALIGRLKS